MRRRKLGGDSGGRLLIILLVPLAYYAHVENRGQVLPVAPSRNMQDLTPVSHLT
jgi:hypothetical protein